MTQFGPSSAFVLISGKSIAGDFMQLDETVEQMAEDTRGLGAAWPAWKPINVAKTTLEAAGGYYDDDTARLAMAIQGQGNIRQHFSYGVGGSAIGADAAFIDGIFASVFSRVASKDGLTKANGRYVCSGQRYNGTVLHSLTPETTASGQSTSVDRSTVTPYASNQKPIVSSSVANPTVINCPNHGLITGDKVFISGHIGSTPAVSGKYTVTVLNENAYTVPVNVTVAGTGGISRRLTMNNVAAQLHIPSLVLGGYTNVIIKVRGSVDNTTFTDVATFSPVTLALTSQHLLIPGPTPEFLAMSWSFTGAGSGMSVTPYLVITNV